MGLFDGLVEVVNKEYDRRIKRASEIIEYGMKHGHGHGHHHGADDDEVSIISNVPVGTRIPSTQRHHDQEQEQEDNDTSQE